ncbi:PHP domain-containing protein [Reichenbachiella sp. MALMAid0571]|uniref:PHP domain-containing protein n=1 Tax=Reichenbachiella sp. MALMAid0571 TaxID=3143939 RepID=UPI0032DFA77A
MINNSYIAKKIKLTAKLMELHGENDFKVKAYQKTVESIKILDVELSQVPLAELLKIEGIGKSTAEKIVSIVERGSFDKLDELLEKTPEGVIEMLGLSGFGPKKIALLWKEGGAESLDELLVLCRQGKVATIKGFAEKTQETLIKAIEFKISTRGMFRYANIEPAFKSILEQVQMSLPNARVSETGALRRRVDIISYLDLLVGNDDFDEVRRVISEMDSLAETEMQSGPFTWVGYHKETKAKVKIKLCKLQEFDKILLKTTGSIRHLNANLSNGTTLKQALLSMNGNSEAEIYESQGLQYIEPEMREGTFEIQLAEKKELPKLVEMSDLKGILHNHSTYSDGKHTLRQMAEHCKVLGYEYLGISDHSQTAVYANGLYEYTVKEQQEEIRKLNIELAPFRVFSGIESDILADGSLDYPDEVLAGFDFIVASVHSGLNMDINKATNRLLTAIRNPHTTILGHMTGRLLLEREGYPVDHQEVINACAENNVVIEINASPYRLDMDWRWVNYALEKGVVLSINPDAHSMEGYKDMYYGLLTGRKGGLTKEMTLNSKSVSEISDFFQSRKEKILS